MARKTPNAPSRGIWLIALIIGGLGILGRFLYIPEISGATWWLVAVGFVLLALGTSSRGI